MSSEDLEPTLWATIPWVSNLSAQILGMETNATDALIINCRSKVLVVALQVNHFKVLQQFRIYSLNGIGRTKAAINQIF